MSNSTILSEKMEAETNQALEIMGSASLFMLALSFIFCVKRLRTETVIRIIVSAIPGLQVQPLFRNMAHSIYVSFS